MTTKLENVKCCSKCSINKNNDEFYKRGGKICISCNNNARRLRYNNDIEHRKKLIKNAIDTKKKKILLKQAIKKEADEKIGKDNKKCKYCNTIKLKTKFRHNRLKCKDCERDEPLSKLIRMTRTRIINCIKKKNKHTIEYLGCNSNDYMDWILNNTEQYTYENYGKEWHIDHVIPLSKFNLKNEKEQNIAFNWRNTMPLSVKDNLSKNNKIIKTQTEQHVEKLKKYHKDKNMTLPPEFINLFARYLDAGNPLELSLPLIIENSNKDLG